MRTNNHHVVRLEQQYQRDAFVAAVQRFLLDLSARVEVFGLYLLICVFWGLLLYAAVQFALP